MTTDPVQEARRALFALRLEVPKSVADDVERRVEKAFAAIRREEAARVLPILRAVEWPDCLLCAACAQHDDEGHAGDCALAVEITRLEALVREGEDD